MVRKRLRERQRQKDRQADRERERDGEREREPKETRQKGRDFALRASIYLEAPVQDEDNVAEDEAQ